MRDPRGVLDPLLRQLDDAIRFVVRQRPEQHAVHDTEDCGIGPDTDRERDDGHQRKDRTPDQHPQRETNITHAVYSCGPD